MGRQQRLKKKQRQAGQDAMEADDAGGWQTGPLANEGAADDFLGMDTAEAGTAQQQQQEQRQPGEKLVRLRGKASSKQKQRKRKSLEKALAVASRKETKVAKTSAKKDGKKGLKKLWTNDSKADK
ncbi:hypothetical protein C2E21_3168 [Chlorella sorokiniana]|uniref:Uncharacterized protein n=1 Tax=Chlorella sorokiniana TaxID=3076 RepID=A0A2P6TWS8_CHLSO|nr:hypothetical protein C2E21_3168 [Chlorella sorokiniana]|eukprot:PRW58518.1 hypothetical protein C2E21_3168 [Chlorella sorokiniana]